MVKTSLFPSRNVPFCTWSQSYSYITKTRFRCIAFNLTKYCSEFRDSIKTGWNPHRTHHIVSSSIPITGIDRKSLIWLLIISTRIVYFWQQPKIGTAKWVSHPINTNLSYLNQRSPFSSTGSPSNVYWPPWTSCYWVNSGPGLTQRSFDSSSALWWSLFGTVGD